MNADKLTDPFAARRYVYHEGIAQDGKDVYPPELYEATKDKVTPAGLGDDDGLSSRVVSPEFSVSHGKDVYPPELYEAAMKNYVVAGEGDGPTADTPKPDAPRAE